MNNALYIFQNESYAILANDIESRREYLEHYVGKLHCPTPGCSAQLDYVELPYSNKTKIFRTHKGSQHDETCPYCITHQRSNAPTFSSETFSQAISEDHIKSILKGLYHRNTEPLYGSSNIPSKSSTTKHHRDITPSAITRGHALASLDPNALPVITGEREPSVRKRRSQDLLAEDNNRLRGIDGIIDNAKIGSDYIELQFATTRSSVTLLIYNAFRDKSEQAYQLVVELAHQLSTTDLKILVCCLGVVEIKEEKTVIQIMSPNYITFEGLSIYRYMSLQAS